MSISTSLSKFIFVIILFLSGATLWSQPNTLSGYEAETGWKLLFDGKTMSKWRGYNASTFPEKGWIITEEYLQVGHMDPEKRQSGGDIITLESYENFELVLEFLLQDTSNSGIFYLVKEAEGRPIWHNAPEYQILDNAPYIIMGFDELHHAGSNYALHAPVADFTNPVGEWNVARIVVQDRKVEHWLNGKLAVAYALNSEDWKSRVSESKFTVSPEYGMAPSGPVGLQDHGQMVRFRNIKIRKL